MFVLGVLGGGCCKRGSGKMLSSRLLNKMKFAGSTNQEVFHIYDIVSHCQQFEKRTYKKKTRHRACVQFSSASSSGVPPSIKKDTKICIRRISSLTVGSVSSPLHISKLRSLLVQLSISCPGGLKSLAVVSFWTSASKFSDLSKAAMSSDVQNPSTESLMGLKRLTRRYPFT